MIIRVTGLVAWYLLVGDVICGTMISGGVARITVAYPRKFLVHRVLGWALLAAVAVHIGSILYQHYQGWGLWQVAVPSPAGPLGRNFGVVATWLLLAILALAVLKKRIPKRQWHWFHRRVTFVLLAFGTAHGLLAGSLSQGTQLPVILPAVVALTFLASVCLVRANVTATHRRKRHTTLPRHMRRVSLYQRYWPNIVALATLHAKEGEHVAKRTRQARQARSMRMMFGLVAALGVSVLILGAVQFSATGLKAFITRQGGVGATPDTKDCGHLSACGDPLLPRTSGKELAAASAHRQQSRKSTRKASSAHRRPTPAGETTTPAQAGVGTSTGSTSRASTTTTTMGPTIVLTAPPATPSTLTPAIRRITTTTTAPPTTTTTTSAPTPTTPTTTTTAVARASSIASKRRHRDSEVSSSAGTTGAARGNTSSHNPRGIRHLSLSN